MTPISIIVSEPSHVSAARIATERMAVGLDFDTTRAGRAALIATEAVTNMIRHGGGGTFAARVLSCDDAYGIEMLAIDAGAGMSDFEHSATDGVSTRGTAGTGLGAIRRLSDEFDVNTVPGGGTILRCVLWNHAEGVRDCRYEIGAIAVPKSGENYCGDSWAVEVHEGTATFLVADGLGHGPDASRAAALATAMLARHPGASAGRLLEAAHANLRHSRGAAVAVIQHDSDTGQVAFAGIGNIGACIVDGPHRQAMVSHNGIVGHNVHRIQEYHYAWPAGALLVAHSDGLESRWDIAQLPGTLGSHPSIIAAALYRRHSRRRDDVVVLVAKAR